VERLQHRISFGQILFLLPAICLTLDVGKLEHTNEGVPNIEYMSFLPHEQLY